jgi:hypothetical protein
MQIPRRMLAAVTVALLAVCVAPTRGAEAAPRARATKQATSKHATAKSPKAKRPKAERQAKSTGAPARRSADEPEAEPESKPQRKSDHQPEPKVDPAPTKPAPRGGAVSQADDSEDPPVRQRAK